MAMTIEQCNRRHEDWQREQDAAIAKNAEEIVKLRVAEGKVTVVVGVVIMLVTPILSVLANRLLGG